MPLNLQKVYTKAIIILMDLCKHVGGYQNQCITPRFDQA